MNIGSTTPPAATPQRVAIYTRYSSNMQRPASLADQERNCRKYADEKGWTVLDRYVRSDAAKTGKMLRNRHALESLIIEAEHKPRPYDVLIVDEQSRLGRNLKDILGIAEVLKHYGIKLVLVAQGTQSDDASFHTLLTLHGMVDEQNSERMRHRVLRGQEGRVRQGFTSGSRCFGYRSVQVPDPTKLEVTSRADILGTKWVVIESEAETIRRIFRMYADGMSDYQICLQLNAEKVPAARKPRIGTMNTVWNCSLIKGILKRDKYVGRLIWNKTTQVVHPVTDKTETRKNPPEQWVVVDVPKLRIVEDELWDRVQERLNIVNERMTRRRIAGCNRAKAKPYLFGGLLVCGECGSSITVGGGNRGRSVSLGCVSARYKRGCPNNLWIREDRLAAQLIEALANNLLAPEVMKYFVGAVSEDLDSYLKGNSSSHESSLDQLRARESELSMFISRLVAAIMNTNAGQSTALPAKLSEVEAQREQVRADIALCSTPKDLSAAKLDLDALVRANVSNLLEVIKLDVLKARQVLQRHIKKLTLYPVESPFGPAYEVIGEIDLFASSDRKECMLLVRSSTGTVQQYANVVDFTYRFAGLPLYIKTDPWQNALIGPLGEVLRSNPELLHQPRLAKDWAEPISSVVPKDSHLYTRLNPNFVSWQLRNRIDEFAKHYGMVEIVVGRDSYFMFTNAGTDDAVLDAA
jgi:site-specific DNA recombinase